MCSFVKKKEIQISKLVLIYTCIFSSFTQCRQINGFVTACITKKNNKCVKTHPGSYYIKTSSPGARHATRQVRDNNAQSTSSVPHS